MALSDRKKKILRAVVDGYIETANPISSKEIQEKHLPDCSSATIRNELSALESMGYLTQPHVSAGRFPSQKAFRLYVDELMEAGPLTEGEIQIIDKYFSKRIDSIEDVVTSVAKVLTDVTNYTSVVVSGHGDNEKIESIKLLAVTEDKALVVIVTDVNVLKDNFVDIPENLDEKALEQAQKWLNKLFGGKTLKQICTDKDDFSVIADEFALYRELYDKVFEILVKMSTCSDYDVKTLGSDKIYEYPEYNDRSLAKNFISTLEQKQQLAEIFTNQDENIEFAVSIGQEEDSNQNLPEGMSVVSARISLNDKVSGSAGVIGPVRMNYKKVVSVLDHIGKLLDNILGEEDNKRDKNAKK